jgi:autotransporter-associated beta strand protein
MIADGYDNGGTITYGYYTLHHNWWSTRADQRMPASSFGRIHMYNNYFNCTNNSYCSNARNDTEINSETNYYAGVKDAVTVSSGTTGKIRTSGNTYSGCTGTIHPGTDSVFIPPYSYSADLAANVPAIVTAGAGAPGSDIVTFLPKIWDGGGANDNLNTANNWGYAGGYNEIPKEYDVMIFAGNTRLTPNNSYTANTEFTAINFSNNAGAFVLSGNAINLGQGISSESPATQTVNLNFSFAWAVDHYPTDRYFNVGSPSGSLVLNGAVSGPVNTYGRTYSVTKLGPGLLTLAGINGFAGSFNLNGGLLRFSTLDTALPGSLGVGSTLTFNGGGLQWAPGNTADISARNITINSGGATLDVGSNIVTVTNRIGNNGPGGLTKLGSGTLVFNATNNYKGNALVAEGVLALGLNGLLTNSPQIILSNGAALDVSGRADGTQTLVNGRSLTGSGTVRGSVVAAAGSTIAPGFSIGTLVITNALTFQANSTNLMELDATTQTNDLITGMSSVSFGGQLIVTNLSGALAAGNSFKLFNAGNYGGSFDVVTLPTLAGNLTWTNRLGIDGTIAVVAPVNTMPTNIIATPVGNELALDWPADHIGWIVQVQTNTSGDGLGTNWVNVPDSEATNHISFPMDPENGAVFFRLMLP